MQHEADRGSGCFPRRRLRQQHTATACAHRGLRLEEALNGNFAAEAVDEVEIPVEKMNSDIHASAEYRAHLVKVMTKRAVEACS